jgi:predicted phosphoribosyltransferase
MLFQDRFEAGRFLASKLRHFANRPDVVVLALPRGGVPVGYEVAKALNAPLDVFVVRKLGVPGHEELAMGAITSGGVRVLNESVVRGLAACGGSDVIEKQRVKCKSHPMNTDTYDGSVASFKSDKFVAERLACVLRMPSRKGCR